MVNVQQIELCWGDGANNAAGARIRSTFPEILPINKLKGFGQRDREHDIYFSTSFVTHNPEESKEYNFIQGEANCLPQDNRLGITWYNSAFSDRRSNLVTLKPGQWVQLKYYTVWKPHYRGIKKVVLNIHFGDINSLDASHFMANEPVAKFSRSLLHR